MAQTAALPILSGETGLTRYLEEIRRFPMLEPQEEFMLAKRWREHGDRDAAHKLVTSHLRLVAKIAMGYRGYGLPISEVISEGNVGLMQAVKRFEPDKGFRLATYAMWWIKAAIQEYILRSWSLVKMGTTANQKKLFFNLRKAKSRISALDEGDMRPDQVKLIAKRLGVTEQDVIDMNRRLGGDASLNAPIREDGDSGEWMDWLVDDSVSQESRLAESEQSENRHKALGEALTVLNDRERRIFEARRLADEPITLEELADEFGVSRERVRQIEVRAFEKVQKAVKNNIAHMENPHAAVAAAAAARVGTNHPCENVILRCPPKAGLEGCEPPVLRGSPDKSGSHFRTTADFYFPAALRSAALMRSCQPGPSCWKKSSTSRSIRSVTVSFPPGNAAGAVLAGPSTGLAVTALKAFSAAARALGSRRGFGVSRQSLDRSLESSRPID